MRAGRRAHSERGYQFAAAFAATDGVGLDDEVLYLGTVLHDVGLSPAAEGGERFEVRGANLMRMLLLDHGMERDQVANVWDCHRDARFDPARPAQEPRDPLRNRGIALDVRLGRRSTRTHAGPRGARPLAARRRVRNGAGRRGARPSDSVRMSWLESVPSVHVPGFVPTDFLAGLRASEGFA